MAIITNSIGSAGGRDYSSISAWEAALPADIVAAGNSYVGACYNDSEFFLASEILFAGVTTDASHTITLQCAAGQSFTDTVATGSTLGVYDQTKGVGLRTAANYVNVISIAALQLNTLFDGLQIKVEGSGSFGFNEAGAGSQSPLITRCLIHMEKYTAANILTSRWTNCVFISRGNSGQPLFNSTYSNKTFNNCTFVRPTDASGYGAGNMDTNNTNGVNSYVNCACFGFAVFVSAPTGASGDHNCADITVGFGTSNQDLKTFANQFNGIATASLDLKLKAGSDCIDTGSTTGGTASTDIIGTARPQGTAYDIGVWEFVFPVGTVLTWLPQQQVAGGWPDTMIASGMT